MKQKIMIIEDNMVTARQISFALRDADYGTKVFMDGESALREWNSYAPDLLLLDLHLPGMDGFSVCHEVRKISDTPIIIISVDTSPDSKIQGLDLGADDYVDKPFHTGELMARIRAVLRRYQPEELSMEQSADPVGDYVEYPGLFINQTSYTVRYDNKELSLPPKELELLYCLASSPNRVFTREQLLDYVWGYDYVGDPRTVDVHIKRLREKIKDHETWSLSTVWGVGYKFTVTGKPTRISN